MLKKTLTLRIGGMICVGCQQRIEKRLVRVKGVQNAEVNYSTGVAAVTYDAERCSPEILTAAIEKLDYKVLAADEQQKPKVVHVVGILVIIVALYMIVRQFEILNLLLPGALANEQTGYLMLFVIGLTTSVHCIAMCGGINISQSIPRGDNAGGSYISTFRSPFLYNLGRVITYTVVGFIVGALGAAFSLSYTAQAILKMIAGVIMVVMGISLLGIFPWLSKFTPRMPKRFVRSIVKEGSDRKGPLIVGLLNGFMPCGPLQAMQIYALSTGSPLTGALSMFLFGVGTVPLMFGLGAVSSALGQRFTKKVMTVGAVLVAVLGLSILSQGLSLSGLPGFNTPLYGANTQSSPPLVGGLNDIQSNVANGIENGGEIGIGSDIESSAASDNENGVGNSIRDDIGSGVVNGVGNSIGNDIEGGVVNDNEGGVGNDIESGIANGAEDDIVGGVVNDNEGSAGNSIRNNTGSGDVSSDVNGIEKNTKDDVDDDVQMINSTLLARRYPSITVEAGRPVKWTINAPNGSINGCNSRMLIQEYGIEHAFQPGDNVIEFTPTKTGTFRYSCWMGMIFGSITVIEADGL